MSSKFNYTVCVPVRFQQSEGIPWQMKSIVTLDTAQATCNEVMSAWHKQHPEMETLLSVARKADFTINDIATFGSGVDCQFQGVPTP